MKRWLIDTLIGKLELIEKNGYLTHVSFENHEEVEIEKTDVLESASLEIGEYLSGKRKEFDIPIQLNGTPFELLVWKALLEIPYGKVWSYQELAEKIGNPKACRAVGAANRKNPLLIIVPCHRVIGKNGNLSGYVGGIEVKKCLLNLEKE